MDKTGFLIGIDIGTTNVKCIAANLSGHCVFSAKVSSDAAYKIIQKATCRQRVLDGNSLWGIVSRVCRDVMRSIKNYYSDLPILGIGVASVGCSFLMLDKNFRQLFYDDTHNINNLYKKIKTNYSEEEYFIGTGYSLESGSAIFRIANALENKPSLSSQVYSILSVADYINYRLTGEIVNEYSTACSWGMWDINNNVWCKDLLSGLGISKKVFSQPLESGVEVGFVHSAAAKSTELPKSTPVFTGGHDYLCASYSTGCIGGSGILNVLGTYEMVATFHDYALNKPQYSKKRTLIDHHVYPKKFSFTTETSSAGQTEWLKKILTSTCNKSKIDLEWNEIFKSLNNITKSFNKGTNREIFIPRVNSPSFPNLMNNTTGGYFGTTSQTTPVDMLRATIEGLCFLSKDMFEYQMEVNKDRNPCVTVVGGGSNSNYWLQTKADILGLKLTVPRIYEATALGAALLAGVGAKIYSGHDEATRVTSSCNKDEFIPDPDRSQLYIEIYQRVYLPLSDYLQDLDDIMLNINKRSYEL